MVLLGRIVPESPAADAGLAEGDRVRVFAGEPVQTQRQLQFLVAESPVGEPLTCLVERDGAETSVTVTLTELDQKRLDEAGGGAWLGLEVANLEGADPRVERLRSTLGIESVDGLIVVAVEIGRPGAAAGIRPGDVLVAIEDRDLPDLAAWKAARIALRGQRDSLNLMVRTGTTERFVRVTPRDAGTLQ